MGFYTTNQGYIGVVGSNRSTNLQVIGSSVVLGAVGLYPFSNFTFTNGTQVGRFGPDLSNLLSSYNTTVDPWLTDLEFYNAVDGIQFWTVPADGLYQITCYGAQGGGDQGGLGASIKGTFTLTSGEVLNILVGHVGLSSTHAAGGGGVSAAWRSDLTLLVAAGAGGGVTPGGTRVDGCNGQIATSGSVGQASPAWNNYSGGDDGGGGASSSGTGGGGSGGGWLFDAGSDSTGAAQGLGRPNGWLGGISRTSGTVPVTGSFGGGGGASSGSPINTFNGGAGGGGYSGGGAGVGDGDGSPGRGGGGGSFNSGSNRLNQTGIGLGDGLVEIALL